MSLPRTTRRRRALGRPLAVLTVVALAVGALGVATANGPAGAADASTSPCPSRTAHAWCDTARSPDQRALLFQQAMTLDEEISLIGGNGNGAAPHTGATYAVPRLGLRAVFFSDGPVGTRQGAATAMPIPMALAATWDPTAAYLHGKVIAEEARAKGNDVVFAPTVNVMRTPQNGRTYEGYGEETYLIGRTGVQWIKGAQSTGVIANVKHYLANNQEGQNGVPPLSSADGGRMVVDARVSQRALREVYMPQFEAAVKQADTGTIMCSYNRVNGTYACENSFTLQQVLEKEWGFKGIVLADYGASKTAVANLNNGLDFIPNQGQADQSYQPLLVQAALTSGAVTRATLDGHVLRILRTFFAYGVFDRPAYDDNDAQIDVSGHQAIAEQIEEKAITLLKNNGVLPLATTTRSIAVIGPYANRFVTGGGSGTVTARRVVTALQGIQARAGAGVRVTYVDGSDKPAAAAAAAAADVAVVVVGDVQTEGQDKSCVDLNCDSDLVNSQGVLVLQGQTCLQQSCPLNGSDQDGLIDAVAAAQAKTVVVMETGGPVLTPWRDRVAGVVSAWFPGQEGGTAIARVLFGDVDPGGRLPATFPASADQLPTAGSRAQYPGVAETADYTEDLLVGYKWYDAHNLTPAYPFGAGLSYTSFSYGPLRITPGAGPGQVATATATVTNTGGRTGTAVPQLYISKPATAELSQPVRQLVGYQSVSLPPGVTATVSIPLNDRSFASWGGADWVITPGCYDLDLGSSSRALTSGATVARGACGKPAALSLPTTGDFSLPQAPDNRVTLAATAGPPRAAFRVRRHRPVSKTTTTLNATTSRGTGLTYAWDFHDGGSSTDATGPVVRTTYRKPGRRRVTLTVTDVAGQANAKAKRFRVRRGVACSSRSVVRSAGWDKVKDRRAPGGDYCTAVRAGATLSYRFRGQRVALGLGKVAGGGSATLTIDGKRVGVVSFAGSTSKARFGRSATFSQLGPGRHRLVLRVRRGRALVDGFVSTR